jgi:hypothetical protein
VGLTRIEFIYLIMDLNTLPMNYPMNRDNKRINKKAALTIAQTLLVGVASGT